jgi:hypothetical protein
MFAVPDEDDQQYQPPKVKEVSSIPDASTLLHQCVHGGAIIEKLADPQYWEGLAEATAALYPCDPLTVGNKLGYRKTAAAGGTTATATTNNNNSKKATSESIKILNELDDKGYCIVPPESVEGKSRSAMLGHSGGFGGGGVPSVGGFGGMGGFTPGMLSSGTFGGDGLAFINSDDNEPSDTSSSSSLNSMRSAAGGFGMPSNEYDLIARAVRVVEDNGWPPVFALMFDAPWQAVQRAWSIAAKVVSTYVCVCVLLYICVCAYISHSHLSFTFFLALCYISKYFEFHELCLLCVCVCQLGDDCELEPSLFIWSLTRNVDTRSEKMKTKNKCGDGSDDEEKRCARIGQNFGLPHRYYT